MKQSIGFCQFCDAFTAMDRQDSYTYEGKRALFDYLEEMEEDTGIEIELDVVALCCDYSEYDDAATCISECGYGYERDEDHDDDEHEEACLEWLRDNTTVITFSSGIIVQDF